MSAKLQAKLRALCRAGLPATRSEVDVLHALAHAAWDDGSHVYPGVPRIAAETRLTERWVRIVLRRFLARGWISLVRPGGGAGRFAIYQLNLVAADATQPTLPMGAVENRSLICTTRSLICTTSQIRVLSPQPVDATATWLRDEAGDQSMDQSSTTRKNTGADAPAVTPLDFLPPEDADAAPEAADLVAAAVPDREGAAARRPDDVAQQRLERGREAAAGAVALSLSAAADADRRDGGGRGLGAHPRAVPVAAEARALGRPDARVYDTAGPPCGDDGRRDRGHALSSARDPAGVAVGVGAVDPRALLDHLRATLRIPVPRGSS